MKFEFVEIILFFLCVQCFISMQVKKKGQFIKQDAKKTKKYLYKFI